VKPGRWFVAKAAIIVTVIVYLAGNWWLIDMLTRQRPTTPSGAFVVPFEQQGAVTYVTRAEHWTHIALIAFGVALVIAWWLVEHFEKRSRKS
jgi:hypothetical protein